MKRAFWTDCINISNGLKASAILYWTDCSFAERERLFLPETSSLMSDFKMLHVSFQNGWDSLIDRTVAFLGEICFCKSFDLSRRSEIRLLTSFLHRQSYVFHLLPSIPNSPSGSAWCQQDPYWFFFYLPHINFLFHLVVTRKFFLIPIIAQK